jgi:hypothetical protein
MVQHSPDLARRLATGEASALPTAARLFQAERTASRVIGGQAVVIAIDQQRLHVLNGVGTRVWELLEGRTRAELVAALTGEYEVDAAQLERDLDRFLEELSALGAVAFEAPQAGDEDPAVRGSQV